MLHCSLFVEARHERHLNRALFERNTFMTMVTSGRDGFVTAMQTFGPVQNSLVPNEPQLWPPLRGWFGSYRPNRGPLWQWASRFLRACEPNTCGIQAERDDEGKIKEGSKSWRIDLGRANLEGANLRGADLRGAMIDESTQIGDKWRLVWRIVNQGAAGANLREAYLFGADLGGADLRRADLDGADLRRADLRGANLGRADLGGAHLGRANLEGANLEGANLGGANLGGAHLVVANLVGAHLGGAHLGRAYLRGANLEGAENTTPEQLAEACVDATTTLPDGSKGPDPPTKACKAWERWRRIWEKPPRRQGLIEGIR